MTSGCKVSNSTASAILVPLKMIENLVKVKIATELEFKGDTLPSFLCFPPCNPSPPLHGAQSDMN